MGLGLFSKTIRHNGGVIRSLLNLYNRDSLKYGKLVGVDKYGNRYYENNDYFFLRNRWVEYADHVGLNYDGSQVPAEWFGWLHHRTDLTPDQEPFRPKYSWILPHEENMTGTPLQYVPWTTTPPKILPWVPPKPCPSSDSEGDSAKGCGERAPPVCEEKKASPCEEKKASPCEEKKASPCEEKKASPCEEKKASPCEERSASKCEKEEKPSGCREEEVKQDCREKNEEEKRPACEKPSKAFH